MNTELRSFWSAVGFYCSAFTMVVVTLLGVVVSTKPALSQSVSPVCAAANAGILDRDDTLNLTSPQPPNLEGFANEVLTFTFSANALAELSIVVNGQDLGQVQNGESITQSVTLTINGPVAIEYRLTREGDFKSITVTCQQATQQQALTAGNAQALLNTIDVRTGDLPDADAGTIGSVPFVTAYANNVSNTDYQVNAVSAPVFSATDNRFQARWFSNGGNQQPNPKRFFVRGAVDFLTGEADGEVFYGDAGVAIGLPQGGTIGGFIMALTADTDIEIDTAKADFETDGVGGTLYLKYPLSNTGRINLKGTYFFTDTDVTFSNAGAQTSTGHYDTDYWIVAGAVEKDFALGKVFVTPAAGFSYRSVETDSYTDSAGVFVDKTISDNFSFDFDTRVNRFFALTSSTFFSGVQVYGEAGVRVFIDERDAIQTATATLFSEDDAAVTLGFGWDMMFHRGGTLGLDFRAFDVGNDRESLRVHGKIVVPFGGG